MIGKLGKLTIISALVQVANVGIVPLLTIYYNPVELGEFRYLLSLSVYMSLVFSLSYDRAIYKQKNINRKFVLFFSTLAYSSLSTIFIFFIYLFGAVDLNIVYVFFLSLLLLIVNMSVALLTSESDFKKVYSLKLISGICSPLLKLMSIFTTKGMFLVYASEIISRLLWINGFNNIRLRFKYKLGYYYYVIKYNYKYLVNIYPGILLNGLSNLIPLYVIKEISSFSEVGLYSVAILICQAPIALVSSNMAAILQSTYMEGELKLRSYYYKFIGLLVCLFTPYFGMIYLQSDLLVDLFFKNDWNDLSLVLPPIIIWSMVLSFTNPLSTIFHLVSREAEFLYYQIFKFLVRGLVAIVGLFNFDFITFVYVYSLANMLLQLIQVIYLPIVKSEYRSSVYFTCLGVFILSLFICFISIFLVPQDSNELLSLTFFLFFLIANSGFCYYVFRFFR